ncbi:MAG: tetratricopeptide repeat protein, partial [Kiritimatiellae bacterium]|nr:tetratricopeptide repeat protein [Kiritimatiellia bacterium]
MRLALAPAAALAIACATPARAQETLSSMREQAFRLFSEGEFTDALPYFERIIEIQGASTDAMVVGAMERVYWNAALCKFFSGDFPSAQAAFERYNAKYRRGIFLHESFVYIGDALRYQGRNDDAISQYATALKRFRYPADIRTDIHANMARCHLAQDDWQSAVGPLRRALASAPDALRRNRAATLLATAFMKTLDLEEIYRIVPYLLTRDSLASRSVAFNVAALEAGDALFADERYREAFWIHRLIYPYDDVLANAQSYLDRLNAMAASAARYAGQPRRLMRMREWIADTEAEVSALQNGVQNYDAELSYRIARGYMEARRHREARELFLHLHRARIPERAEECLYLAFLCSVQCGDDTRTHGIARLHMDEFPRGEWYDPLTLMDGQLYARAQDWKGVIAHFSEVLTVAPAHESAAECLYLLGYAHFMEEEFEQSRARLMEIRERFPQSELIPDAIYWCAMASIFNGDFEAGAADFDTLISDFPDCRYAEDALFRRAICAYALADYPDADARLADFASNHQANENVAEAIMTRADIAGAEGRIDDAVGFYRAAMGVSTNGLNIEQFNHCAFQCGQILYDAARFQEVREHFTQYIRDGREGSNIPLAIYWIGRAMQKQDENFGALKFYQDAALKFGRDRLALGVDMILDEWAALARRLPPAEAAAAWENIAVAVRNARNDEDPVAALRFSRLLLYRPNLPAGARERELDAICNTTNLPFASPAVMELMLDTARSRAQTNLAVRVAHAIITDFTETDYALSARAWLADVAVAQAEAEPAGSERAAKLYAGAIRNLTVIREVYATQPEAADALLKLGAIYSVTGDSDKADDAYRSVLGVREWRPFWPQALLGRGKCAEAKSEWLKAAAYYERIYIMYSGYRDMAAKAYLARAKCLRRGYEVNAARETLQALLANDDFKSYPEYAEAERLLSNLGSLGKSGGAV